MVQPEVNPVRDTALETARDAVAIINHHFTTLAASNTPDDGSLRQAFVDLNNANIVLTGSPLPMPPLSADVPDTASMDGVIDLEAEDRRRSAATKQKEHAKG